MKESVANNIQVNEGARIQSSIAMTMALVSFSMLFATLMLSYFAFRFTSEAWPPLGIGRIALDIPTMSTFLILISSLTYYLFETTFKTQGVKSSRKYFVLTFILGMGFMLSQFRLWAQLKDIGVFVDSSVFSSMIYAFTWIHAAHVVGGVIALFFLIPSVLGKRKRLRSEIWLNNVGQYWHFLGIVWLIMYFSLFVF